MTPDFKKYLKLIGGFVGAFIVGLITLSFVGRYFIEEISQPLFVDLQEEDIILQSGRPAPYFELHNLKGKLIKLTDYKDILTVIVFWNTWGENSQNQIKIIDKLLGQEELFFRIITINSQEDRKIVSSFINRGLYSKPEVLLDFNGSVSDLYEARNLPAVYFIDKEGLLRDVKFGVLGEQEIVDNISKYNK